MGLAVGGEGGNAGRVRKRRGGEVDAVHPFPQVHRDAHEAGLLLELPLEAHAFNGLGQVHRRVEAHGGSGRVRRRAAHVRLVAGEYVLCVRGRRGRHERQLQRAVRARDGVGVTQVAAREQVHRLDVQHLSQRVAGDVVAGVRVRGASDERVPVEARGAARQEHAAFEEAHRAHRELRGFGGHRPAIRVGGRGRRRRHRHREGAALRFRLASAAQAQEGRGQCQRSERGGEWVHHRWTSRVSEATRGAPAVKCLAGTRLGCEVGSKREL
ncbi:DUF1513 domain-containing protein [Corallococcus exercitus]|nr:DUF1513 domain-containing protein [Corallococcus exercitus]